MILSVKELTALHSLAGKVPGDELDWINAADADALRAHGLATQSPCGAWLITKTGQEIVDGQRACTRRPTEYKPN